jgi:hypothetical protein
LAGTLGAFSFCRLRQLASRLGGSIVNRDKCGISTLLRKTLEHPVVSSVLVVAIVSLATYLFGGWGAVVGAVAWVASAIWNALSFNVAVPIWLLIPLVISALALPAYGLCTWAGRYRRPKPSDYREDTFEDVTWRWRYGRRWLVFCDYKDILELKAYCPEDEMQLTERTEPVRKYDRELRYGFWCDKCRKVVACIDRTHREQHLSIKREIDRKLRTGEWKAVVENSRRRPSSAESE